MLWSCHYGQYLAICPLERSPNHPRSQSLPRTGGFIGFTGYLGGNTEQQPPVNAPPKAESWVRQPGQPVSLFALEA